MLGSSITMHVKVDVIRNRFLWCFLAGRVACAFPSDTGKITSGCLKTCAAQGPKDCIAVEVRGQVWCTRWHFWKNHKENRGIKTFSDVIMTLLKPVTMARSDRIMAKNPQIVELQLRTTPYLGTDVTCAGNVQNYTLSTFHYVFGSVGT